MKGGVGKTTLAAMFAKYIAQADNKEVVVVDVDPQQGATMLLLGSGRSLRDGGTTLADVLAREQAEFPLTHWWDLSGHLPLSAVSR